MGTYTQVLLQTCDRTRPSYQNKYKFMKVIDQLPTSPEWSCELVRPHRDAENDARVAGDEGEGEQEELELWMRDPVACIR